ncbi:hypothetical protein BCR32DRAFT_326107 [Anaeromyces robustus]|uniref:5-formyltetrahydrofolate cyclo-ligase n=1 Tax=Anaeromyces robustus TaxID=1754192 RepID=A0A1Y1XED9_9FUNG|nr:hypothetical protein BCR32DRAFT_326107 [Anaeromyces robustus]|eukprot:ORX84095.1 hypothetical protein BCR32DRAFT_326107 [Anaeromyces robustus]
MAIEQNLTSDKKLLRKQLRKLLQTISEKDLIHQSNEIYKQVISLKQYQDSKNISIYLNMPKGEVKTENLLKHALNSGKNCYVPYIINNTEMEMVKINSWEDFLLYPKSKWGYPEPSSMSNSPIALKSVGLDLIIVPGMAFDINGNRLGHGNGYYDRYIERAKEFSKLHNKKEPYCVSLSLNEQLLKNEIIPTNQYDIKPDLIISPQYSFSHLIKNNEPNEQNQYKDEKDELDDWELEDHEPISVPIWENKKTTLQTEEYYNGYVPQIKILKRNKGEFKREQEEKQMKRIITSTKSLKQREEEYRIARKKIFGSDI